MSDQGTQQSRRVFPPTITPETQRFWDAAAAGKLLYGQCNACKRPHYFPRSLCPFCFSDSVDWKQASGRATIYTYSIMRRSATGPFVISYVTLEEGPRLLTNIVDSDLDAVKIGAAVTLVFKPSEGGQPVPFFKLERSDSSSA
jgi:uncharacterized OB-fold protein